MPARAPSEHRNRVQVAWDLCARARRLEPARCVLWRRCERDADIIRQSCAPAAVVVVIMTTTERASLHTNRDVYRDRRRSLPTTPALWRNVAESVSVHVRHPFPGRRAPVSRRTSVCWKIPSCSESADPGSGLRRNKCEPEEVSRDTGWTCAGYAAFELLVNLKRRRSPTEDSNRPSRKCCFRAARRHGQGPKATRNAWAKRSAAP